MMKDNFIGRKLQAPLIQNLKIETGFPNAKRTTRRHLDPWNSLHIPLVKAVDSDSGDGAEDYAKSKLHNQLFVGGNKKLPGKVVFTLFKGRKKTVNR
jgi:hypothetical protein